METKIGHKGNIYLIQGLFILELDFVNILNIEDALLFHMQHIYNLMMMI